MAGLALFTLAKYLIFLVIVHHKQRIVVDSHVYGSSVSSPATSLCLRSYSASELDTLDTGLFQAGFITCCNTWPCCLAWSVGHGSLIPSPWLCKHAMLLDWSRPNGTVPFRPRQTTCPSAILISLLLISGDVEVNPGPATTELNINFGLININSVRCKAPLVHDLISDYHLDMLALTETRLQSDMPAAVKLDAAPPRYGAVWCCGYDVGSVNRVKQHWARLVLG